MRGNAVYNRRLLNETIKKEKDEKKNQNGLG